MHVDKKNNQIDSRENNYKNSEINKKSYLEGKDIGRKVYDST